jgi:hypothetical protein
LAQKLAVELARSVAKNMLCVETDVERVKDEKEVGTKW